MELLGHRLGPTSQGQPLLEELKNVKNVALVFVTATVPPGGAQQGDMLDCTVSAISAKSLEGGQLMLTELYGPLPATRPCMAWPRGWSRSTTSLRPQTGRIPLGCQVETKFQNEFVKDGKLTLVMNKDHAAFQTTAYLEKPDQQQPDFSSEQRRPGDRQGDRPGEDRSDRCRRTMPTTRPCSPRCCWTRASAPPQIDTQGDHQRAEAGDHRRRRCRDRPGRRDAQEPADPDRRPARQRSRRRSTRAATAHKTKLDALVDALNALKVPAADVIDIIKMLKHKRALFGELIIE